jgi:hypothetical protein
MRTHLSVCWLPTFPTCVVKAGCGDDATSEAGAGGTGAEAGADVLSEAQMAAVRAEPEGLLGP